VEILALQGAALARLHQFSDAEKALERAATMCQSSTEKACGDFLLADGVLAMQQGKIPIAQQFFQRSSQFARANSDDFLRATALLNLGAAALQEEHFDETIEWTNAAYQLSTRMGFGNTTQTALGNLGFAYYKLGDFDKSLELSLEAAKRASQARNIILDLYWTTNTGYVYAGLGDLASAKKSYLRALELANKINSREGIYNALRALALVSVADGELDEARKYSDQATTIARADHNRLNELYPLLVKALVAAQTHDTREAERLFREVELDSNVSLSLKWRSQHGLARLYEAQQRLQDADREYRSALTTFEAARTSVQRGDSRLPFSNNARLIYDDYIHFLVGQGKTNDALQWADHSRARTLAEGLRLLPKTGSFSPAALNAQSVARRSGANVLFYWLGEKVSYLWVITPQNCSVFPLPPAAEINVSVQRYRKALGGPQDVLQSSNEDGRKLYSVLVALAQAHLANNTRVVIIPDGSLNNLNFETLLVTEPKPHFWIEDATVITASSLRLLAAASMLPSRRDRNLLLIGNSISPNEKYPELPKAALQMDGVAAHFPVAKRRVLARDQATPAAYLASDLNQYSYIHFVAHGTASRLSPLDSAIILSPSGAGSDSFKLYARDIIREPLRAQLVTISSCYGAGERAYSGEGLVGLSWAFLRAGAHNVIAALWEATDVSTEQLMGKFYDQLDKGMSPDAALRAAKLSLLHESAFRNPFYWAPFQLYAGS
jgi:CHAT domain-containing protein